MQKAVEWEMIDVNPFRKGKRLPYKLNNQRDNCLTEEQADRLLEECAEHLRPIIEVALLTGMRREELLSLRWDQVRDGLIHIGSEAKGGKGRKIPINQKLAEVLKRQRQMNQLISDYVFCDGEGKRFYDVRGAFRGACRRAGIDYGQDGGFTFHDLRHTFASWLVMRGVGLMAVKELLGHASLTMTMRYAHLSPGHLQEAVGVLDGPSIKNSVKPDLNAASIDE
jgi:integrase